MNKNLSTISHSDPGFIAGYERGSYLMLYRQRFKWLGPKISQITEITDVCTMTVRRMWWLDRWFKWPVIVTIYATALFVWSDINAQTLNTDPLTSHEQVERAGFLGDVRTIRWTQDCNCTVDFNKLRIYHRETGLLAFEADDIPGDVFEQIWIPLRAGHYWVEMEACINDDPQTPEVDDLFCSAIASSLDGQFTIAPRGFVFYFKLKAPTEGGIER